MSQKHAIILSDGLSFINLLKLKKKLAQLKTGDLLEVVTGDAETVRDLEKIVRRSEDRIIEKTIAEDRVTISILKGSQSN